MGFDTNTYICWRIVLPNGEDWDQGDGVPHFESEKDGLGKLGDAPPGTKVVRFDAPCVTVTCSNEDCAADVGGDDVFSQIHSQDLEEACKVARESDWKITLDGRTYCWDCPVPEAVPTDG